MSIAGQVEVLLIAVTHEAAIIANIASEDAKGKLEYLAIKCTSLEVTQCHFSS